MKNVQITMQEELLSKLDEYAKSNFMNRSACISMICNQHLQALEVTKHLKDLTYSVKKLADGQDCDEETLKKIEDFERLTSLINFKS